MKQQHFPKVSLRKLSHEQIRTILQRIVDLWEEQAVIPMTIRLLLEDILTELTLIDKILLRVKHSSETAKINEVDALRDRAYTLLVKRVRDSQGEFDQNLIDAGADLLPIIEKFNWDIVKKSYAEETTLLNLALSEFRNESHIDSIAVLNIEVDIARVETFASQFETLWDNRSAEEANKEELSLLRTVRRSLHTLSTLLFKNSEYLFQKNHASIDEALFNSISDELSKAGAVVKMRETLSSNEESVTA